MSAREPDNDDPIYEERPELAVVALVYMLARFPWTGCLCMADSILRHLRLIAVDQRYDPALRAAAERIHGEWQAALAETPAARTTH